MKLKQVFTFLFFLLVSSSFCFADDWFEAVSRNAGNYVETYKVSVNSTTAVVIYDANLVSATADIFNNTAYTVWIGTNAANLQSTGFPVLSSTTYTTDGVYTGELYGLLDSAGSSGDVRTIYYKKNR